MTKSALEIEVADLRAQLRAIEEQVRIDAVAEAFLAGNHDVREGDYFLYAGSTPTRLSSVSSNGKWTYWNGNCSIEPYRIPEPSEFPRLYTIEEVAAIVSKASTK